MAREHSLRSPGEPIAIAGAPGDYGPKTIEELTAEADVVMVGTLTRVKSYLGANEQRIYTDYSILPTMVVAGRLPVRVTASPGAAQPLILTRFGGEVLIEGVVIRATDDSFDAIKDGGRYLLFLRPAREGGEGHYEVHYGGLFEIAQEQVTPLLKKGDEVFKGTRNAAVKSLLERIQSATQPR